MYRRLLPLTGFHVVAGCCASYSGSTNSACDARSGRMAASRRRAASSAGQDETSAYRLVSPNVRQQGSGPRRFERESGLGLMEAPGPSSFRPWRKKCFED
jgi:hypothetical protein